MVLKRIKRVLCVIVLGFLFMTTYGYGEGGEIIHYPDSLPRVVSILKQLEMEDSLTGARVIVNNNTNVMFFKKTDAIIKGYRIRLFFDNSQSARAKADEIKSQFESSYPEHTAYLQYSAPYFNVSVGDFISYQDALVFSKKILKDFPKAFIVPYDIPVLNLGTKVVVPESDSTANNIDSLTIE